MALPRAHRLARPLLHEAMRLMSHCTRRFEDALYTRCLQCSCDLLAEQLKEAIFWVPRPWRSTG